MTPASMAWRRTNGGLAGLAFGLFTLAAHAMAQSALAAPPAFGVSGREVILAVHAEGAQVYQCTANVAGQTVWAFREPIATLIHDGKTVGRHFLGPAWALTGEGMVKGKVSATAPGATGRDIAWLKLDVVDHEGDGLLKGAAVVLRLNTNGGVLDGPCAKAGDLRAEPYAADYEFLR